MAATEDFRKPTWLNPLDTDMDQMRDNMNYLLTLCAAGAEVAPGWITVIDISTTGDYSQPDAIRLTKGTRAIEVKIVWV